ncbi:hypothetical protein Tco_1211571 [Tanacetum coccineum]
MAATAAQQIALDNALVAPEKRVEIGKCNMRINPKKTQKEPTYRVVLDALALNTRYPAFLITADVPIGKKRFSVNMEVFREILQICPRLLDQEFDEPPSEEEILSFIKELGHTRKIKNITVVVVDHIHQPWRAFAAIINKCLSGKITGLDKIRLSRAQILWGMYYKKNIDFVALLWEDFSFQIDNRDAKKQEKIFVSKDEDTQVYGALIPTVMTTPKIRDSPAYQTYLAFATGATTPKTKRIYKKAASPRIKTTTTSLEETPSKKKSAPAKKDVSSKKPSRRQFAGVRIRDTPGVSVSKKKAPAKAERSKRIEFLSDAALLEEAHLKKALKRSKRETKIHQAGGSSEGADFESEVPDEPKGKLIDTSEGTGLKPGVPDVSEGDSSESEYESWGDSSDEANVQDDEEVQDSDDEPQYVDDERTNSENQETNDDEEETEDEIDRELYGDVNVRLTDAKPDDEDKGDKEMTNAETVDAEHENVIQESAGNQVKDDAQATQKTKVSHLALAETRGVTSWISSQHKSVNNREN